MNTKIILKCFQLAIISFPWLFANTVKAIPEIQNNSSTTVYCQKNIFATPDSLYQFTSFTDQQGLFYFKIGFGDSSEYPDVKLFLLDKYKKNNSRYQYLEYFFVNSIDTIYSYNSNKAKKYSESSTTQIIKNIEYNYWDLLEDIEFSYILKRIGIKNVVVNGSDTILRLLYPHDNFNLSKDYIYCEVGFNGKYGWLVNASAHSRDSSGIKLVTYDSLALKEKDIDIFRNKLINTKRKDVNCMRPGNPWLLSFKVGGAHFQYVVSEYCVIDKKSEDGIALFYLNLMFSTKKKYFH